MRKVAAGLLIGIGILVAGASGLCMALMLPGAVSGTDYLLSGMTGTILLLGGVPFALGVGAVFLGRHLLKNDTEGD